MEPTENLSAFLAGIERRAFRQAMFATQNQEAALDIVQEAMLKLAEHYAQRPADEWPLLFQRILQNVIRDHHRRSRVRSMWISLLSALVPQRDDDEANLLDSLATTGEPAFAAPDDETGRRQTRAIIDTAIARLPLRQRQAFLLRYLEELDVAQTAAVMGCSEGSVKTHCSRACHTLAAWLEEKGIRP
ncbi:RNA polymerase sigma factor [Chitinimonas sp. BJYL2]|uniref:RNA polymerase sigma factor n=1 Tax=Chitinimonas sp. BJYL2 TaxID=2976696 RepID=UPI0022B40AEC|nr:RNA polymerase sigma factor [Chitinimonas sp. BJYL2]